MNAVRTAETIVRPPRPRSLRRVLSQALVSPRSTDPAKRRPTDFAVAIVCVTLVVVTTIHSHSPSELEIQLALFLNRIPAGWSGVLTAVLGLGALWVVAVMAGLGFLTQRRRLSLELIVAGVGTWVVGRVFVRALGGRPPPSGIHTRAGDLHQYPTVRLAVAVAVVAAAAPYLTRLARWLGWSLVTLMTIAAAALGLGLPNDIVGGLVLGWAGAAIVHFVFGSPVGRPSLEQIGDVLDELGIEADELHFTTVQEPGSTSVLARTPEHDTLFIRAYGRDERDSQLLSKLWRFVWYEDSGPTLYLTRLQLVEHEAYAMLLAQQAGVPVPSVVAATTAGPGTAVLVERHPDAIDLNDEAVELTDELLDDAWRALLELRGARIAHGGLDLSKVLLAAGGMVVVHDFSRASTSASDAQLDADAARLLAATATRADVDRAVAAAHRALGSDALVDVLAYLQPPVVTDRTRQALKRAGVRLSDLRSAGAAVIGGALPTLAQLERVQRRSIAMAVVSFVGIYVLFGQLGNFTALADEARHAQWGWIALAAALATATNLGYAMSYAGSTTAHLPFGRNLVLQMAGSFTNVVTPNSIGTAAINARFLQVRGVRLASAIASQVINTVTSGTVQLLLFVAVLPAAGGRFDLGLVPWRSLLTAVVAVGAGVLIALGIVWRIPQARHFVTTRVRPALTEANAVVRSPAKVTLLLSGNVLVQLLYALSLGAVCRAFGVVIPVSTLIVVNIGSSAISGLVPAPGGLGVAEATLAGALTAAGVPSAVAVAATLTQRLVTTWMPPLPGWFALRSLERGEDL